MIHEISKGLEEQRNYRAEYKRLLKQGPRVEKGNKTSLYTERHGDKQQQ